MLCDGRHLDVCSRHSTDHDLPSLASHSRLLPLPPPAAAAADIFWVCATPVMVSVAKNFDAPIKLLFPRALEAAAAGACSALSCAVLSWRQGGAQREGGRSWGLPPLQRCLRQQGQARGRKPSHPPPLSLLQLRTTRRTARRSAAATTFTGGWGLASEWVGGWVLALAVAAPGTVTVLRDVLPSCRSPLASKLPPAACLTLPLCPCPPRSRCSTCAATTPSCWTPAWWRCVLCCVCAVCAVRARGV